MDPKIYKGQLGPVLLGFLNKTNFRVICLFTARAVDSELTHMWPSTSVNNHGRTESTNYLRLSQLTALSAGVNNHLRCIHKGLTAFLWFTPPITWSHYMDPTNCSIKGYYCTSHFRVIYRVSVVRVLRNVIVMTYFVKFMSHKSSVTLKKRWIHDLLFYPFLQFATNFQLRFLYKKWDNLHWLAGTGVICHHRHLAGPSLSIAVQVNACHYQCLIKAFRINDYWLLCSVHNEGWLFILTHWTLGKLALIFKNHKHFFIYSKNFSIEN